MKKAEGKTIWDVIVIGGGPSGMMAAARAGERGLSVLLLEKNKRLGKKLSITGGGRCNVTNNKPNVRTMLSSYKDSGKFLFSTFMQHGVAETIEWFAERGVPFAEENDGRLFPETRSAETICKTMQTEVEKHGVTVHMNVIVSGIKHDKETEIFEVALAGGKKFTSKSCVLATGGTSRPETGSAGEGFDWLDSMGHTIAESNYALVPFSLADKWVSSVSGVTLPEVKIHVFSEDKKVMSKAGKLLFTHVGVSGPTILNMSSKVGELLQEGNVTLKIDLFPKQDEGTLRTQLNDMLRDSSNRKLRNVLSEIVPKSLVNIILELLSIEGETPGHSVSTEERSKLVLFLKNFPLKVNGLLGADKAVVTNGGVSLKEINFKTMGSLVVPNLFLVGDMLDIDRPSGGYSLQLCWSTGYVAGSHVLSSKD